MKVTIQTETRKENVLRLYYEEFYVPEKIAKELDMPIKQVKNILSRDINKRQFGKPVASGICFGHRETAYQEGLDEMDCHSNYVPTFSWETLSETEQCMEINPEHLINFKETLQRLRG